MESAILSGVRLRIVLVVMSRFPLSVNLPQRTRQSYFNLCRVWKVREWRLWSRWFKVAISAPCSFPPPPSALLRKFFLPFLSACCNELEWMSSEANVLRRCAALDELRLESLRGPPSRRSSYWLGRDINPFSSWCISWVSYLTHDFKAQFICFKS
jgi:hypothetical protein